MTRLIEGDVVRRRCSGCGSVAYDVVFSGENDMATMGLISLASVATREVVIAEAIESELISGHDDCGLAMERRLSAALQRDDLRFVPLLRTELQNPTYEMSFQEFKSAYRPPLLIYACPHCAGGEATAEATQSFDDFEREGGKLTTMGDLKLAS